MPDTPAWGYQAYVKQELIEQAGGVVRSSAGLRAKDLDLRHSVLFTRIRSKPWSRHTEVFSLDRTVDTLRVSFVNTEMTGGRIDQRNGRIAGSCLPFVAACALT